MKNVWKTLSSKEVYKNPWIKVQEDRVIKPDGKDGIYGFLKTTDSVAVVALDKNKEIYLVKQWRYIFHRCTIELPWGSCEKSETLLQAAKRELEEESGVKAKKWKSLGKLVICPGLSDEIVYLFLATDLHLVKAHPGGDEKIEVIKIPFKKAYQWACQGNISDAVALAAILRVKKYLKI